MGWKAAISRRGLVLSRRLEGGADLCRVVGVVVVDQRAVVAALVLEPASDLREVAESGGDRGGSSPTAAPARAPRAREAVGDVVATRHRQCDLRHRSGAARPGSGRRPPLRLDLGRQQVRLRGGPAPGSGSRGEADPPAARRAGRETSASNQVGGGCAGAGERLR